jgi:putative transposase
VQADVRHPGRTALHDLRAPGGRNPEPRRRRAFPRGGPRTELTEDELLVLIRKVITECLFPGQRHRKWTAWLSREHGVLVGRKQVLKLMREAGLLASQRARRRGRPTPKDGKIIPAGPDLLWGTDATMAFTNATAGCGSSP